MAKRKQPSMTPEERARCRREARELSRVRAEQAAAAMMPVSTAYLIEHGALVPGESPGDRARRLDRFRQSLAGVQTSTQGSAAVPVPDLVEIEF